MDGWMDMHFFLGEIRDRVNSNAGDKAIIYRLTILHAEMCELGHKYNYLAASRGPSSDAEISTAIGPERGGLQICDFTRN